MLMNKNRNVMRGYPRRYSFYDIGGRFISVPAMLAQTNCQFGHVTGVAIYRGIRLITIVMAFKSESISDRWVLINESIESFDA
ncbi:hypothetical protein [Photobacterium sp. GB-50]|uniref:hypothetical protein n=2 Tax=Photobacterium TaxID=657 RepID=UPI001305004F|nr:hypothetical protein [Photobacterium sp. GB-50]